ncbi:MAG: sporulation protein YabP [Bacillota bacterium]|jgi:sporulation protein YabP
MSESKQVFTLYDREKLVFCGVLSVESFDTDTILLVTNLGDLLISGENLHINQLDLEQGQVGINGYINSLVYQKSKEKSAGFLKRLLK